MKKGPLFGKDFEEALRKYYPTMSASEIARLTGYKIHTIYKWVAIWGLKHDEATAKRLLEKKKKNFDLSHTQEVNERIRRKRLRMYRMERFRIMSGMPQKTKCAINLLPQRTQNAIRQLCRGRNYYRTEPNCTLYYDSQTRRCNYHCYTEEYFTRVYGITFKKGDE